MISISAIDSGFNKNVTNGIAAAIPIISKIACINEKKIIIKNNTFCLFSKSFQKLFMIVIFF
jgi:hypothetical protein